MGSIAVASWAAHITYAQVLIAGFIEGSASVFFGLAQRAALPMLGRTSSVAMQIAWGTIPGRPLAEAGR